MKRKVVLLAPPTNTHRNPEENLGIECLAAVANLAGHEVRIIDSWLSDLGIKETVAAVQKEKPDVLGLSPSMDSIGHSLEIVAQLRKDGFKEKIILGGVYASFEAESILKKTQGEVDGIIIGEAEETFVQFLHDGNLKNVPNAVYWQDKKIIKNLKSTLVKNLDSLPFPDRSVLPLVQKHKTPVHVSASRGCYNQCDFCSIACYLQLSQGKKWRCRTPKNIVDELKLLSKIGVRMVKFTDDSFFGPSKGKERGLEIAKRIKQAKLNIRFRLSTRVNDVDGKVFKQLKEAGLFAVSIGVESSVQRKLDDYKKRATIKQNLQAMKILDKLGIYAQMGFILFDPFVTVAELERELTFLKKTKSAIIKGICTRLFTPDGTPITERVRKEIGFVDKLGPNNIYEIIDPRARLLYFALRDWNKYYASLYEMVIDPLSAPKVVSPSLLKEFHRLYLLLKDIDLLIFEKLLSEVRRGLNRKQLENIVSKEKKLQKAKLEVVKNEAIRLYEKAGLSYNAGDNKYL